MFSSNYNGNITGWVFTSTISDMSWMFASNNTFNRDISGWNVASATNMSNMFGGASAFDQDLTGWNVGSVTNMATMLDNSGMSTANYDLFLINLDTQSASLTVGLALGAQSLTYTTAGAGGTARTNLTGAPALMSFVGDSGV
jgi:surface protein